LTYEELQSDHGDLFVLEMDLCEVNGLKGLYMDGCAAIDKNMTNREKGCVLAEEIGHHLTSSGDILDQDIISNRKQEYKARMTGYDIKIGLQGIIEAYEAGCHNIYDIAEHLDVTEEFLHDAIKNYRSKYGLFAKTDGYIIYFEPALGVMKIF
jgi:hypothetical protein